MKKLSLLRAFVASFFVLLSAQVLAQNADLVISKSGPTNAVAGTTISYQLDLRNNGPAAANNTTFSDTLPAGLTGVTATCLSSDSGASLCSAINAALSITDSNVSGTLPLFPNTGHAIIQITAQLPISGAGSYTNTATISPPPGVSDPSPGSNTSTINTSVSGAEVDLKASVSGPTTLTSGAPTDYVFTFSNQGVSAADNAGLRIPSTFSSFTTYFSFDTPTLSCTASGGAVCPSGLPTTVQLETGPFGDLFYRLAPTFPAGSSITLTLSFKPSRNDVCVKNTLNVSGSPKAIAVVPTDKVDLTPTDNTASMSVANTITGPTCPTAASSKTGPASFTFGSQQQYNIALTNTSSQPMDGYLLTDSVIRTGDATTTFYVGFDNIAIRCTGSGGAICPDFSASPTSILTGNGYFFRNLVVPTWPAGGRLNITVDFVSQPLFRPDCGGPTTADTTNTIDVKQSGSTTVITSQSARTTNNNVPTVPCPQADIAVTRSGPMVLTMGVPLNYTLSYTNNGPDAANGSRIYEGTAGYIGGFSDVDYGKLAYSQLTLTCTASGGAVCPSGLPSGPNNRSGLAYLLNTTVPTWPAGGSVQITVSFIPGINSGTQCSFSSISGRFQSGANVATGITDPVSANNFVNSTSLTAGCADLAVNKQQSSVNPTVGTPETYTITVSNSAPGVNAAGAVFSDPLPEGFQYDGAGTCAVASGSAICGPLVYDPITRTVSSVITSLPASSSVNFTLNGTIVRPGSWRNTAAISTIGTAIGDPLPASNSSTVNLSTAGVDLHVEKVGPALYTAGSPISYALIIKSFGDPVDGALIEDNVPAGITGVTWTCSAGNGATCGTASGSGNAIALTGDFQQGGSNSGSLTITVHGTVAAATTGNLVNTAKITPPLPLIDLNPGDNTATVTSAQLIPPAADLSISKSAVPSQYPPGIASSVAYTVTAFNAGPDTAAGATITDTPPPGLTIGSWTCTASAGSSCPASGSGTLSAALVTLAANGSAVFTLQASVSASATGILTNTVTITPPVGLPDPDMTNNQATANLAPGIVLSTADLSINKSVTPAQYVPGTASSLTYSIVVSNNGPHAVTNALVTDTPDSGLTIGSWTCTSRTGSCPAAGSGTLVDVPVSLPAGGSATFLVSGTVTSGATGIQTNSVTVVPSSNTTDLDRSNNTATASVSPTGTPTSDLQLTKSVSPLSYTPGITTSLVYTLTTRNNGPMAVSGATVTDSPDLALVLGDWSCIASSGASCPATGSGGLNNVLVNLPVGAQAVFTVNASIANGTLGSLLNSATITPPAGTVDSDHANNTDSATVTQNPAQTDLRIQKSASISSYVSGIATSLTYTVQVFNDGPLNVVGAVVHDEPPTGVTLGSWTCTSAGGSCPVTGSGALSGVLVDLPAGASATFSIHASVDTSAVGNLLNTASIDTPRGVTDSNPSNNSASADIINVPKPSDPSAIPVPTMTPWLLLVLALSLAGIAIAQQRSKK